MIAGNGGSGGLIAYLKGILSVDVVPDNWMIRFYCGPELAKKLHHVAEGIDICVTGVAEESGIEIILGKPLPIKMIADIDEFEPDIVFFCNGYIRRGLESYPNMMVLHNQLYIDNNQFMKQLKTLTFRKIFTTLGFRYRVRQSLKEASAVVFLSEFSRNQTCEMGVKFRSGKVIPFGFESENRATIPQVKALNLPIEAIYISALFPYKNHIPLIKALAKLKENGCSINLKLVGNGSAKYKQKLCRLIRKTGLGNNIEFCDWVEHSDIKYMIDESDIFIYASSTETTGYGLLEGMARGVAIVSSDKAGFPLILGEGGKYFNPDDVDSICETIRTMITDEALRDKSAVIALERCKCFSWESHASALYNYLSESISYK